MMNDNNVPEVFEARVRMRVLIHEEREKERTCASLTTPPQCGSRSRAEVGIGRRRERKDGTAGRRGATRAP